MDMWEDKNIAVAEALRTEQRMEVACNMAKPEVGTMDYTEPESIGEMRRKNWTREVNATEGELDLFRHFAGKR